MRVELRPSPRHWSEFVSLEAGSTQFPPAVSHSWPQHLRDHRDQNQSNSFLERPERRPKITRAVPAEWDLLLKINL